MLNMFFRIPEEPKRYMIGDEKSKSKRKINSKGKREIGGEFPVISLIHKQKKKELKKKLVTRTTKNVDRRQHF